MFKDFHINFFKLLYELKNLNENYNFREHQIESSKFWERVLGPQYELYLINMDRCNDAVIKRASLPYRVPYSTIPKRVRLLGGIIPIISIMYSEFEDSLRIKMIICFCSSRKSPSKVWLTFLTGFS